MKTNETVGNKIGIIGIAIWLLLSGVFWWIERAYPPSVETVVRLDNPYPCINRRGEWVKVEKFAVEDNYYICGVIKSNKTDLHEQIEVRIYENELSSMINAVHYDLLWISAGDQQIPIRTGLLAGRYVAQINMGKKTISVIKFEVTER